MNKKSLTALKKQNAALERQEELRKEYRKEANKNYQLTHPRTTAFVKGAGNFGNKLAGTAKKKFETSRENRLKLIKARGKKMKPLKFSDVF